MSQSGAQAAVIDRHQVVSSPWEHSARRSKRPTLASLPRRSANSSATGVTLEAPRPGPRCSRPATALPSQVDALCQSGFQGRVLGHEIMPTPIGPAEHQLFAHEEGLYTPGRGKEKTLADLRGQAGHWAATMLNLKASCLEQMVRSGVGQAALELPQETSKTSTTLDMYKRLQPALSKEPEVASVPGRDSRVLLENLCTAFGLNLDNLCNSDPEIHSPERAYLVQRLFDEISVGLDTNPILAVARTRFDDILRHLENGA